MKRKFALLQSLAILSAVFQYGMRAAGEDEGRNSNRILFNVFYPYLTARYVKKKEKGKLYTHVAIRVQDWQIRFAILIQVILQKVARLYKLGITPSRKVKISRFIV